MANKITWADKVALQEKPDVVAENKVTAADMNQIKTAVNGAIDAIPTKTSQLTNDSNYVKTTGNVATADKLKTARNIKIGNTSKSFNGSADVTWSKSEIGYPTVYSGTTAPTSNIGENGDIYVLLDS